jgi:transcriptional regulator with XRE-family HTH domain
MTPAEQLSQAKPRRTRKLTNHPRVWQCAVRRERERLRLSLDEVSEAVGMSKCGLWQVERGSDPMLTTAWKLAHFFGFPIADLWKPESEVSE